MIDETLPAKLLTLHRSVELVDRDGHVVAVVHPRYDLAGDGISEEELEAKIQGLLAP